MAAFDMRNPDQHVRITLRRPAFPSDGDARLAALHVGFLARARARRYLSLPALKLRRTSPPSLTAPADRTARLRPLSKASRGSLGIPSGIVRLATHGSSLPGGAGLANLPGAVANRIGDTTALLRLSDTPPEAPLGSKVDAICSYISTESK